MLDAGACYIKRVWSDGITFSLYDSRSVTAGNIMDFVASVAVAVLWNGAKETFKYKVQNGKGCVFQRKLDV